MQTLEQVRQFYNQIGWKEVSGGVYQNARYEDLRPVSREYIHRCHMRVKQFLNAEGRFLLDAGCGPIQYPEYLTYSEGYDFRVCLDISITAILEARKRIGKHGLFVIADVANLPFKIEVFDGLVSLHTLHHLPVVEQKRSYDEFFRVLAPEGSAVVVNGWRYSILMRMSMPLITSMERIKGLIIKLFGTRPHEESQDIKETHPSKTPFEPQGTFVEKLNARSLKFKLSRKMNYKILCWRSVSVRFLRVVIHSSLGGKYLLRWLFWMEEQFPRFFGEKGQYPLVVIWKSRYSALVNKQFQYKGGNKKWI